jgi:feruloyl esterase
MFHCSQGPGAWNVGQGLFGDVTSPGSPYADPDKNVLMAAVRWVEEGTAPEAILGTKFVNDTNSLGVEFSRNHCKFPLRSTYDGSGDSTKPKSWSCQPVYDSVSLTDSNTDAAVPLDIQGNLLVSFRSSDSSSLFNN